MTSKTCPICKENWYDTHKYYNLCFEHTHTRLWYATVCKVCGCACFSTKIGLCINCAKIELEIDSMGQTETSQNYGRDASEGC
jgi:hypothetical protein